MGGRRADGSSAQQRAERSPPWLGVSAPLGCPGGALRLTCVAVGRGHRHLARGEREAHQVHLGDRGLLLSRTLLLGLHRLLVGVVPVLLLGALAGALAGRAGGLRRGLPLERAQRSRDFDRVVHAAAGQQEGDHSQRRQHEQSLQGGAGGGEDGRDVDPQFGEATLRVVPVVVHGGRWEGVVIGIPGDGGVLIPEPVAAPAGDGLYWLMTTSWKRPAWTATQTPARTTTSAPRSRAAAARSTRKG